MSFWGKILGGAAGFALGGPFGAMVGAALGHAADQGAMQGSGVPPQAADLAALLGGRDSLFAVGVVVLSAKLAKADGSVKRAEIDAFKQVFHVPPENMNEVARLFDQARDTPEGWEPFANRLGEVFADNKAMLEDVLSALVFIARADGPIVTSEGAILRGVHKAFALDQAAWERAKGGGGGSSQAPVTATTGPDPYAIFGLPRDASDEDVHAAWRKLMRENHPDALASRGVPQEFIKRATDKVAEINAAWDRIKRERGMQGKTGD